MTHAGADEMNAQEWLEWLKKGVALREEGKSQEALEAFDKAAELDPQSARPWLGKGLVLRELERPEEALEAFEKAAELDPQSTEAWLGKGLLLGELGRHEEAIEAFDKAAELDPQSAEPWAGKGLALRELERPEEALEAFDKAAELDPQSAEPWAGKGLALRELGRREEALEAFDKAAELDPQSAEPWYDKGNALYEVGRYKEAIEAYEKVIELNPQLAEAWYNKGNALYEVGRYEEAIEAYEKVIELNPQLAEAWYNKGRVLYEVGRYEEAIEAYEKVIELNPQYAVAWNNKGCALDEVGRYEEAIEAYEKAIEINPQYAVAWYNRGFALRRLRRYEQAVGAYERAAQFFGDKREEDRERGARGYALLSKGMTDWAQGRFEEMKKHLTSAKRVFKELAEHDVANSLALASRLIPIERAFLEALAQDTLESTREHLRKLMRRINRIRPAIDKCEQEFVKVLLEVKLDCITVLKKSLEFEEDDLYEDLTSAEMVFKHYNFSEALKTVNNLKNFVLDLKEYPSLEAIPGEEKERLVLALNPFKFLDGALTEGVVGGIPGEPYLAEPTEAKPEEAPVSLVTLYSGPPKSPVTICVAQIDYQLHPRFPFRPSKPGTVREKILRVLSIAREKHADIVCLPELCMREDWSEEIAEASTDKVIIAGSYYDERRNRCLILIEGKKYTVSKMNPSPAEEEIVPDEGMVPGKMPRAFQTKFGVLIPSICLDFTREHYRIEKHIRNVGEVHFLFVPSYDDSEDNLRAYHERASRDCQEHDLYVFISNMAKGGGSSAFGLEHHRRLQNLESRGLKPPDQFTYKWAEIEKGKEGVIIATVNVPASGVAPYLKKRRNLLRIELLPLE